MRKTIALALGLLIIAAVVGVTGASAGNGDGKSTTIDSSYSGTTVELAVGDTLIIELKSNPSTGFSWILVQNTDETVLQETGHDFILDETADPPMPGSGGTEVWNFKALAAGETNISLEYSQPWDGGIKAEKTFDLKVVIS
jgi:inhibitor of cysteine peptidase